MTETPRLQDKHGNCIWDLSGLGLTNSVRFTETKDGVKFSIIDVIMAATGKDEREAEQFINNSVRPGTRKIFKGMEWVKFKGQWHETKVISLKNVIKLLMVIPGEQAKYLRLNMIESILELINDSHTTALENILQDCLRKFLLSSNIDNVLAGIKNN